MIRTLIVDDEPMQLQGLLRHIDWAGLGYDRPLTAESGEEALEMLSQSPVDVLITDVAMPGMSGIELLSACMVDYPELQSLQTLIISGYDEFEFVQEAIRLGVKGYLLKPIKTEALEAKLGDFRDTIGKRRRLEQETDELKEKWASGLDILRERFVSDLLEGRLESEGAAETWKRLLDLPSEDWTARVFVIRVGQRGPALPSEEERRNRLCVRVLRAAKAAFAEMERLYVGRTGPNEVAVVELNASPEQRALAEKRLIFVQDVMREQDGANALFAVSARRAWRELPRLYEQATRSFKEPDGEDVGQAPARAEDGQSERDAGEQSAPGAWPDEVDAPDEPFTQHRLIRHIAAYLEEHLQEHVTVKQLAERFHLNASYLSVLFKKETGRTISDFVQDARMNRAKSLLQDPGVKVYEVADRVGFQTTAYFSYLFKKRTGVTPQEYRDYN